MDKFSFKYLLDYADSKTKELIKKLKMNNYLEGWFSLKWFYPSQILSYEWGNEYILYLILILPVFLITRKLIRKRTLLK